MSETQANAALDVGRARAQAAIDAGNKLLTLVKWALVIPPAPQRLWRCV